MGDELIIEYGLDGLHPGYRFRPPAPKLKEDTLHAIWRNAMPRGTGWAAFSGARSVKCFPLPDGRAGVSLARVTDQADEIGRRGILTASIRLMTSAELNEYLSERMAAFDAAFRASAQEKLIPYLWKRVIDKVVPRLKARGQIVLAHSYQSPAAWQVMEVLLLRLVTSSTIRKFEGWGGVVAFTTLALDWREEGRIVALPLKQARKIGGRVIVI